MRRVEDYNGTSRNTGGAKIHSASWMDAGVISPDTPNTIEATGFKYESDSDAARAAVWLLRKGNVFLSPDVRGEGKLPPFLDKRGRRREFVGRRDLTNWALGKAVKGREYRAAEEALSMGASNLDRALIFAARVGSRSLFDLLIRETPPTIVALENAYRSGEISIIARLTEMLGSPPITRKMWENAGRGGNADAADILARSGGEFWGDFMIGAARSGRWPGVMYAIEKGADGWDGALGAAARGGHADLCDFFISRGARDAHGFATFMAAWGGHSQILHRFETQQPHHIEAFHGAIRGSWSETIAVYARLIPEKTMYRYRGAACKYAAVTGNKLVIDTLARFIPIEKIGAESARRRGYPDMASYIDPRN